MPAFSLAGLIRTEERPMSFVDAIIPAVFGIIAMLWPETMFLGSKAKPSVKNVRLIRLGGVALLGVAALFAAATIAEA